MKKDSSLPVTVLFERVRPFMKPIIKYYARRNAKVYINDPDLICRVDSSLTNLQDQGKIKEIQKFYYSIDYHLVTDSVERLFEKVSILERSVVSLFQTSDILLALKKENARLISSYLLSLDYLKSLSENEGKKKRLIFFPESYLRIDRKLRKEGILNEEGLSLIPRIPLWYRPVNFVGNYFYFLSKTYKAFIAFLYLLSLAVFVRIIPRKREEKDKYRYAVVIHNPDFQFKFKKGRRFDFILDGKDITKENTLFILLTPIDQQILSSIKADGYNFLPYDNFIRDSWKSAAYLRGTPIIKGFYTLALSLMGALRNDIDTVDIILELLMERFKWERIVNMVSFKHLITFNEESGVTVARNCLMEGLGIETWYYAHSNSLSYIAQKNGEKIDDILRPWSFSYLLFNHVIVWHDKMQSFFKSMYNGVGSFHTVGCLWSSIIHNLYPVEKKEKARSELNPSPPTDARIVSFFGGNILDTDRYILDEKVFLHFGDGLDFFRDILRLLEENEDIYVIIKDKKDMSIYLRRNFILYTPRGEELLEIARQLRSHPRCLLSGHDSDPSWIIGVSDLTIGCAFTSPVIEALGAGRKALFYDPWGRHHGNIYDSIGLVVHGYDELSSTIRHLLYELDNEEFIESLGDKASEIVDPFFDGKALDRFRQLLAGSRS